MNEPLITITMLYLSMVIVFYAHELGHWPKWIRFERWLPFPKMSAMQGRFRYGGLLVNVAIFLGVWYFKPEMLFLQIIGLVSWLHFTIYSIVGSFNYEPKLPKWMDEIWVYDDIPNNLRILFLGLAFTSVYFMWSYYIPIITRLII